MGTIFPVAVRSSIIVPISLGFCLISVAAGVAPAQAGDPGPLTLPVAVTQALAANPAARAAAQQLAQAQARLGQAQAQRRFQITFNSTVSGSNADVIQPPPAHETFGTFQNTLTVPLPIGAKPGLAVRRRRRSLQAAQAQFEGARLALAGQVGTAYYDLLRKQALLQIAQETLAQAQRQLSDAQKRNRGRRRAGAGCPAGAGAGRRRRKRSRSRRKRRGRGPADAEQPDWAPTWMRPWPSPRSPRMRRRCP